MVIFHLFYNFLKNFLEYYNLCVFLFVFFKEILFDNGQIGDYIFMGSHVYTVSFN